MLARDKTDSHADSNSTNLITKQVMIGPFVSLRSISQRQKSILYRICDFYNDDNIKNVLIPMIQQTSMISLRSIDWYTSPSRIRRTHTHTCCPVIIVAFRPLPFRLVTNYAKKHNLVCYAPDGTLFNIYHSYKIALTHFRRRNFVRVLYTPRVIYSPVIPE